MADRRPKITYEIDPHNRLVARKSAKETGVAGFRRVIDGKFQVGKGNTLIYHVKKSNNPDIPQQIKLQGVWALNKEHNLVLTLDKWSREWAGGRLILKGEILEAKGNSLLFAVTTKDDEGRRKSYALSLGGTWQADKLNRLTFLVEKKKGLHDAFTFRGEWEIDKNNKIIYSYEKTILKRRIKTAKTITLDGHWDIAGTSRISYVLSKELSSGFDFRVSAGRIWKGGLRYEIGVGARPNKKEITIFGKWRVTEKTGLILEANYENGKRRDIVFGIDFRPDKTSLIEARLKDDRGEGLAAEAKFLKKILKGSGEIYLKGLLSKNERSIAAGAGFRW